jgi:ATP-dependent helicase/nuclease subunit A
MNWTKEQQKAIDIRDKNILVSAAAGSGKTAVLVERIKKLIKEEQVPLEQMLIVTFTNAAASEMREKIVSAIPEQMNQIHKANISTFHAFALDVIRRYFHLINIEPGFKICDDAQKILLQNEAMEQLFNTKFEEENKEFLHFLKHYAGSKNEEAVKSMIKETHEFIQSLPDPFYWLEEQTEALKMNVDEFKQSSIYEEILETINETLHSAITGCEKVVNIVECAGLESLLNKAIEDLNMIIQIYEKFQKDFETGSEAICNVKFKTFTAAKADKEGYEEVREDVKLLRDGIKDQIRSLHNRFCSKSLNQYIAEMNQTYEEAITLCQLVKEFDSFYRMRKEKQRLIDFSDIEHYALDILNHEEAASEYREKFQYIFIDEYQDSNLVQESLINKIKRDNNVFMVGDVKQSIYKFRLAEPEIFINKYKTFKKESNPLNIKIDLNQNFRSKGQIINLANEVFGHIMTKRTAGMDYDKDAALHKGVNYEGSLDYPVELHLVDERQIENSDLDDEIKEMKKAELEAFAAASIIKEARGLPYFDAKTGEKKILRNKDIVILLRSTANIADIYYEALENEGIPAYMDTGDGFFDTIEVSVFLNLLRVIDNSKQDIPLLSILRSPIFGFSISQLAEIRIVRKKDAYYNAFFQYSQNGQNEILRQKCCRVLEQIKYWKQRAGFRPLADFLWELLIDTGYYNYVGALPGGTQRQGNLRALVDKVGLYEKGRTKGLFDFINFIEAIRKGKVAIAPVKLLGESDDVVRIMTVHKSKGLEFPMVLVGNLGRRFHPKKSDLVSLHKDLGLALKEIDRERGCWKRTLLQNVIDERKNKEDLAEEIRILYVALTRAMDKLVLLGTVNDGEKALRIGMMEKDLGLLNGRSYLDYLLQALADSDKITRRLIDRSDMSSVKTERQESKTKIQQAMALGFNVKESNIIKSIENRLSWEYRYPKALRTKSKYTVSELSQENHIKSFPISENQKLIKAANRGIVYHTIMEHIPFDSQVLETDRIPLFIKGMVDKEILALEDVADIDISKVERFFKTPIGRRVCQAEEVFRETSFNLLKERDGEEIIIQGTIDCYFRERDKYILLDYKSNYVKDEEGSINALVQRYRPQMELYKEAIEQIRGIKVDEMYLYLFAIGKEVNL